MTLTHRHLEIAAGTAPAELPLDALDDLLDRGDFDDWRSVAAAVRRDPYGPLAERIIELCRLHDMYGTSRLWPEFVTRLRSGQNDPSARRSLAELRTNRGRTQAAVATALGISQSDVSKLERRADVRLSTLRRYTRVLDGELHITVRFPGEDPVVIAF